jgi:hypothetical protein
MALSCRLENKVQRPIRIDQQSYEPKYGATILCGLASIQELFWPPVAKDVGE